MVAKKTKTRLQTKGGAEIENRKENIIMKDNNWWSDFYIIEWLEQTKAPTAYEVVGVMGDNYVTARKGFDSNGAFIDRKHNEASSDFPARHFSVSDIENSGDKITLHVSELDACVNFFDMMTIARRAAKSPQADETKPEPVNDNADESQSVPDHIKLDMEMAGRELLTKAVEEIRKAGGRVFAPRFKDRIGVEYQKARRILYALAELGYGDLRQHGDFTMYPRYMGPKIEGADRIAS